MHCHSRIAKLSFAPEDKSGSVWRAVPTVGLPGSTMTMAKTALAYVGRGKLLEAFSSGFSDTRSRAFFFKSVSCLNYFGRVLAYKSAIYYVVRSGFLIYIHYS